MTLLNKTIRLPGSKLIILGEVRQKTLENHKETAKNSGRNDLCGFIKVYIEHKKVGLGLSR